MNPRVFWLKMASIPTLRVSWTAFCPSCLVPGPLYSFSAFPGSLLDIQMPQDVLPGLFRVSPKSAPKCAITRAGRPVDVLPVLLDAFLAVLPGPRASAQLSCVP